MSICLIALIVFAILGIFSAKYRRWAKEAFSCVARRLTLRPCESSFNQRMKAKITSKILRRSSKAARFTNKHFELISWAFTIILFVSLFFTASGLYNLAVHGSCDPHSTTCIFNPGNVSCGSEHCAESGCECETGGCSEANNFAACDGNCDCSKNVCG